MTNYNEWHPCPDSGIRGFSNSQRFLWPLATMNDVVTLKYGKALTAKNRIEGPVPVYGSNGVTGCHAEPLETGPTVILGRKGQGPLGVEWREGPFWVIDTAYFTSFQLELIEPRYFYYFTDYVGLNHLKDGTSNPSLTRDTFGRQFIPLPPLPDQKRIAAVLGALDDKIENNRKMNETLEAMAQAIFKSWFVDFDPVIDNALRAGNPIPADLEAKAARRSEVMARDDYKKQPYAHLFPDHFVDSDLGSIPAGWEVRALVDLCSKIGSGATPRGGSKSYLPEGINLIRSQNVYDSAFVWSGLVHISDDAAEKLKNVIVEENDVLLNITGASFLRTCVVDPSVLPARVNQHVAIVRAKEGIPPNLIHQSLLSERVRNYLRGLDAGASRQAITKGHIESVNLVLPSKELLTLFETSTDPMFDKKMANRLESRTLASLRDTLLPKLISGEIRVPEIEGLVEEPLVEAHA